MEITWEDGSRSTLSGEQLRWACPCAECRGEAGMAGRLSRVKTLSDAELRIRDVTLVGQYALQIAFESGNAPGNYPIAMLSRAVVTSHARPVLLHQHHESCASHRSSSS